MWGDAKGQPSGEGKRKPYKNAVFPKRSLPLTVFPLRLSFPNPLPFRIFTRLLWAVCSVSFGEFRLTSFASGLLFCTFQFRFVARYRNLHAFALCVGLYAVLVSSPRAVTIGFVVCAELLLPVYQAIACAQPYGYRLCWHCRALLVLVLRTSPALLCLDCRGSAVIKFSCSFFLQNYIIIKSI